MATRSRSTFKKRQKELARMEKQRDKAAKRVQRKLEKQIGGIQTDDTVEEDLFAGDEDFASESPGESPHESPETASPDTTEDSSDPR